MPLAVIVSISAGRRCRSGGSLQAVGLSYGPSLNKRHLPLLLLGQPKTAFPQFRHISGDAVIISDIELTISGRRASGVGSIVPNLVAAAMRQSTLL